MIDKGTYIMIRSIWLSAHALAVIACLGVYAFATAPLGAQEPDKYGPGIEQEFYRLAPKIIETLQKEPYSCKNVGVLAFLVQKGDKLTPMAGTLNRDLANRLAVALVLRNHGEPPLGLLRDANAVAAKIAGANHLTKTGRQKLFDRNVRYPLAWGDDEDLPDAFLTGVARISKGLSKMTVELWLVHKQRGLITPENDKNWFKPMVVTTRPGTLTEMGESFLLRGLFDKKQKKTTKPAPPPDNMVAAVEDAWEVQHGKVTHPVAE